MKILMNNTKLDSIKYKIAELINSQDCNYNNPTYEELIKSVYDNIYRKVLKIPINIFIIGIINSFDTSNLVSANKILKIIKEVLQEIFEYCDIELIYSDSDFLDLIISESTPKVGSKWVLVKQKEVEYQLINKVYMYEFFEI